MKKLFLPLALVVSILFSACNDISSDSGSEQLLFGGKAYLTCSVDGIGRKLSPTNVTESDIAKAELLYKVTSSSEEATVLREWEAEFDTDGSGAKTITKSAVTVMTEDTVKNHLVIDAGTYDFTLRLYALNPLAVLYSMDEYVVTQVGSISAKEITPGNNPLSFNTKYTSGDGVLDVNLSWASDMPVAKVQAGLFSVNATTLSMGAEVEGYELSDVEVSDASVRYAKSVPSGIYYLKFNVYQQETDETPINEWCDLVKIVSGATTSKSVVLSSSNVRYSINYVLNVGGEGGWKDGFTPVENRNVNTGVILPTAANIVPPSWYLFAGWYEALDSETGLPTGEKVEAIDTGDETAKNYTLYAKWEPEMDSAGINVSIDVNPGNDIEVTNNVENAIANHIPQITFTAPRSITVTVGGVEQEKAIETYTWKLDGVQMTVPDATPNVLTLDTSTWATGVYDVLLKAKDEDGNYYSYMAQVEWTRLYKVTFNIAGAPVGTAGIDPLYIAENATTKTITEPTDVVPTYGWYTNAAFTKEFDFTKPISRSITLYGCWNVGSNIYVSEDGTDDEGRGTASRPLASIAGAVELMTDSNEDYTVFVNGTITGGVTIPSANAHSITLKGTALENGTEPKDALNGGFSETSSGRTLSVNTDVPVFIENLEIKGGYLTDSGSFGGGLYVGANAEVTLTEFTKITGNTACRGGGVDVDGTLTMKDNSSISGNTATALYGGGAHIGSDGVLDMQAGEIFGNDISGTPATGGEKQGYGVYVCGSSGKLKMGGSAIVGSSTDTVPNDVYLSSGTQIIITSVLMGGVTTATITPSGYSTDAQWLTAADGVDLTTEYSSFAVTPMTNAAGTTTYYVLTAEGKLVSGNAVASTASAYIESMTESGTVTIVGSMDASDLNDVVSAMKNICPDYTSSPDVLITLDLSNTTGLTVINGEFRDVWNIGELVLPEGVEEIRGIGRADNLKTLNIPSTVTGIGELAFFRCPANLTISEENTSYKIENNALYTADSKTLVSYANKFLANGSDPSGTCEVLASAEEILPGAFSQANNLKTLTFATPSSLTKIDYEAFDYCGALEDVILPDSVTELGNGVFQYAHVTSMVLSENITEIPSETFSNNDFTSIVIPDGVKSIGASAFFACRNLEEITLPASLESIAENAFQHCEKLTAVNYKGTEAQKEAMTISDTNIIASTVTWNFVTWTNPPVTLTAGDVTKGTFASLDSALSAIEALDSSSTAYTIYIDGEITGAQTIGSSLYGKASSITLCGRNGIDEVTGSPKDSLNGGFTESAQGTTLTIGSVDTYGSTPSVIVKNLKITGGYAEENGGGIIAGMGANLTISEGTLITGNTAALNGGGVYLCEQVYFTMTGGSITNNSAENGAGIYTNSTMGGALNGNLFNGGGVMSGGTISANTASGNGGGIYLSGTDGFAMAGGTITGNEAEGNGKGVYVASMGSSTGEHSLMMGGSAFIASNNDVYLSVNTGNTYQPNKAVYLLSSLTSETTPVATITPAEYSTSAYVLARPQTSSSSTSVSAEYTKFAVTSQTESGETTVWGIASGGQLKILEACAKINDTECYGVADLINRIKSAESATTVVLYNNLSADEIGKAGTAGTIINAIKSNASSSATFEVSVNATGGKIALAADCSSMFESCAKITSLDMSGFDASGATDMSDMFYGCSELTTLNLNNFDTSNVTDMRSMFANCKKLVTLTLSNSFDTSNVTSMYSMFQSCSSLTAVDLSSFNTAAVTGSTSGFQNMFSYCSSLTTLDVSTFTIVGDANIGYMFQNCSSLVTIYAASDADWNADDRTSTKMFDGCTKLVGVSTSYNSYYVNAERANTTTNGYFTPKD